MNNDMGMRILRDDYEAKVDFLTKDFQKASKYWKKIDKKWQPVVYVVYVIIMICCYAGIVLPNANGKTRILLSLPFVLMISTAGYLLYQTVRTEQFKMERIFLVLTMSWGLIFSVITPFLAFPDGHVHYGTAYALSNDILDIDAPKDDTNITYMRAEDADIGIPVHANGAIYGRIANGNWFGDGGRTDVVSTDLMHMNSYSKFWPTAIGIAIGRRLHLGGAAMALLGGIPNVMFLALCGYIAIKLVPVGRAQIVSVIMIPQLINIYSSYHYDVMLYGITFIFVAMCLRFSITDLQLKWWHLSIMFFIFALLCTHKGCYIPFGFLFFMIPWKKWKGLFGGNLNKKRKAILIAACIIFTILGASIAWRYFRAYYDALMGVSFTSNMYTIPYMLEHPGRTLTLIAGAFKRLIPNTVPWMICTALGFFDISLSPIWAWVWLLVAGTGLALSRKGHIPFRKTLWIWAAIFGSLFAILIGTLARFGTQDITELGFQGRYLLPVFMLALICFGGKENKKIMANVYLIQHMVVSGIAVNALYEFIHLPVN